MTGVLSGVSLHLNGQTFCLHVHFHRYGKFQILGDFYTFALVLLIFINEHRPYLDRETDDY